MSSSKTSNSSDLLSKVYWKVPIPNFSRAFFTEYKTGKLIKSETFSVSSGDEMSTHWFMHLYPNGLTEEYKSNVGLYLWCKNGKDTGFDFTAKFKFGVKKDNGEDCYIKYGFVRSKEQLKKAGHGHPKFLSHEKLFDEKNGYVAGEKLVVFVELTVEAETKPPPKVARSSNPFADFKKMFEYEAFCDFELKTSDDEVLKAHKVVLAARSPVFFAMLTSDMEETKKSSASVLDFDSKVMKEVLRFIYGNEVERLSEIAPELVYAAEKYQLEELKAICMQEITSSVQVGNAVKFLAIAYQVSGADDLFEKCLDLIVDNYSEVSKEPAWEELPKKLMSKIIGRLCERYISLKK